MSSNGLSAAAEDRKARLAALKSLKRKQPEPDAPSEEAADDTAPRSPKSPRRSPEEPVAAAAAAVSYLSGRNYDAATRGPKLGFESNPTADTTTLEQKAAALAAATKAQAEAEEREEKPLDLFKLQPKRPNWDLKRDLDRKLEVLNVRTENAIARLVRERIAGAQAAKKKQGLATGTQAADGDEDVGMEGAMLVEATNVREREDEEDARREREADAELLDGS
ncbi:hypothetical protein MBLNU459_g6281t1 [Dothideomycetes sp. NU459]